ncbi:MAG: VOC family protein [Bacteriovoracaceae bacterium]|nr:VOC family protein [Bacteriovoracaceae bacterium]
MAANNPHTINWFEIPVTDIGRAQKFYETVLETKLEPTEMENCKMAIFPNHSELKEGEPLVHGALIQVEGSHPSDQGTTVYFNGGDDLTKYLNNVGPAGGTVITPKTSLGPHGFYAVFKDSEGNKAALHSPN